MTVYGLVHDFGIGTHFISFSEINLMTLWLINYKSRSSKVEK